MGAKEKSLVYENIYFLFKKNYEFFAFKLNKKILGAKNYGYKMLKIRNLSIVILEFITIG